jgi:hypothetical protein
VLQNGFLSVSGTIALETFFDYFTYGTSTTRLQTDAQINNLAVSAGTSIAWFSDASVTNPGFIICGSTARPTTAPTARPSTAPTARPSTAPTARPTAAPVAILTAAPNNAGASSNSGGSSSGSNLLLYIVVVVLVGVLVIVGILVWAKKSKGGGAAPQDNRSAFNNPLCQFSACTPNPALPWCVLCA